jgi:hypothetical protein
VGEKDPEIGLSIQSSGKGTAPQRNQVQSKESMMQIYLSIRREINLSDIIKEICEDKNKCTVSLTEIYEHINKKGFNVDQRTKKKIMAALNMGENNNLVIIGHDHLDTRSKVIINIEKAKTESEHLNNKRKKGFVRNLVHRFKEFDKKAEKELMEMLQR